MGNFEYDMIEVTKFLRKKKVGDYVYTTCNSTIKKAKIVNKTVKDLTLEIITLVEVNSINLSKTYEQKFELTGISIPGAYSNKHIYVLTITEEEYKEYRQRKRKEQDFKNLNYKLQDRLSNNTWQREFTFEQLQVIENTMNFLVGKKV